MTDGDKKIELKHGFYMEHDEDVCMVLLHILASDMLLEVDQPNDMLLEVFVIGESGCGRI